ncbi:LPS assembly lipoprotein LptE [Pseudomonas sichuanensis]|uniref:LPS-assembly lipoprotein LptE n=1 Tax=Pseudomonas TaxID=286 RepID=UPI00129B659E|nr:MULTISPECIES: LPS assembly lipoprotein LptE [Pseudomonas]MDH0730663.1 LPS assembly lipoprotein LptE [Pseudomonas sichuanensis]MDH1584350.1 LPS assembly lipoprotein LptE [Pseudomonas sichuanensis]MDH1594832.1 LPS assembly lipoprotein LptE [Pseudomonas sichuanensis]MDH1599951.1 LPS assembly lipoprotein LptE [Pseudomonas sichuanensis]MDU9403656.1 LPS assembly lipoprotein LptE [Pseudomonas sp. zfem004]
MIKRNLLVMGLAVLLSACGFQLRGTGTTELTIKELDLSARNAYGDTVKQLRRTLESNEVRVYSGAPFKLVLTNEQETQRAATYSGGNRSSEYELTTVLNYAIEGRNDTVLLEDKVQVQRYYVHNGNNITGSSQEATQVRQEMRSDLVQNMMVRLQQLTPERLDELQHKADERAKAEAQALQEAQRIRDETPQQSPLEVPAN